MSAATVLSQNASPDPSSGPSRDSSAISSVVESLRKLQVGRFTGIILWAVVLGIFALWIPNTFYTLTTIRSIASGQSVTLILALGLMVCLSAGAFDLSIAQNMGFGAMFCLLLMSKHNVNPVLAALLTVIVCGLVGAVNAMLVVRVGIDSFIATLGTSSVLLALVQAISGGQYAGPAPKSFQKITAWQPLGVPVLFIYALIFAATVWYVVQHTVLGRRLNASGANVEAARLSGVRTDSYVAGAFIFTGVAAGLAAVLLSSELGTISPTVGPEYLLPTFAACFLATTQIKPGRFNVGGLLIAIFLLATGVKGLQLAGGQVWIPDLFNGLALLLAVGLTVTVVKLQGRRAKKQAEHDLVGQTATNARAEAADTTL